jgi:hypothetical protein
MMMPAGVMPGSMGIGYHLAASGTITPIGSRSTDEFARFSGMVQMTRFAGSTP